MIPMEDNKWIAVKSIDEVPKIQTKMLVYDGTEMQAIVYDDEIDMFVYWGIDAGIPITDLSDVTHYSFQSPPNT